MRKAVRTCVVVMVAMLLILVAFAGCTKYAKEEQLQTLAETRAAAEAAEKALADCKSETASLEGQLAEKKQALEDMKKEQETVSQRLATM